ncbi:glyoxylase-like metal-dependent hydrolase (beta-lactamase superfamily II) [Orenia marismortui]|uniref:Glyoxylase-like metal-dependent hydrolase (Beta-lactamase superfamily II) n=1 Tax=Orenia marismortui TaxID=46469 RepID=A0A4V3GXR3_9FIRM|nr:glyoxylase-like metal-dependent hydrolase (beta-lactamase superfamily II) [Orenia marismortui]
MLLKLKLYIIFKIGEIKLEIKKVGNRGVLFKFFYLQDTGFGVTTNVYLINTKNYVFVCDTFLGPDSMKEVKNYIDINLPNKIIIIFNSHYDWDHIWGNCIFKENIIISHKLCRNNIIRAGEKELEVYSEYKRGDVEIIPPNLTFDNKISFEEEGVEFFHSPGHTNGSASCIDLVDKVLFAGDNVEYPIPYFQADNIYDYKDTLEKYLNLDIKKVIPGHGEISNKSLIKENITYINNIITGDIEEYLDFKYRKVHLENLNRIGKSI